MTLYYQVAKLRKSSGGRHRGAESAEISTLLHGGLQPQWGKSHIPRIIRALVLSGKYILSICIWSLLNWLFFSHAIAICDDLLDISHTVFGIANIFIVLIIKLTCKCKYFYILCRHLCHL